MIEVVKEVWEVMELSTGNLTTRQQFVYVHTVIYRGARASQKADRVVSAR